MSTKSDVTMAVRPLARLSRRKRRLIWLRHAAATAVCLFMAFPVYWMLVTALQPEANLTAGVAHIFPTHLDFSNFAAAWRAQPWTRWFINTLLVSGASVVLSVSTSVLAGYAFAKMHFWGKSLAFAGILATLIMPIQVIIVPLFRITVDLHMFNSLWGVIIPEVAFPFGVFLSRQYMMSIPDELLEAARVEGAGALRTFTRAVLPLCRPLIAVLILFNVAYRWSDFAWPLIVLDNPSHYTITVGLLYLQGEYTVNYAQMLGMALITVMPMLLLFLFLQRYFVQGLLRSGVR